MGFKRPNETEYAEMLAAVKPLVGKYTIVNVVAGRGHDCGGLICDIKKGSKLIGTYHDDGWGGEPEVNIFDLKDYNELLKFIQSSGTCEITDAAYGMKTSYDNEIYTITSFIELLSDLKYDKKWVKLTNSKLIYGVSRNSYNIINWKGVKTLNDMVTKYNDRGVVYLQKKIDDLVKDGKNVLTNPEYLTKLGIKINK